MAAPLEGIRVLDWTFFQQGPVAASMLSDMGADVIKIEDPVNGDPGRGMGQVAGQDTGLPGGRNFYFENNNRGKRSFVVDLKKEEGRQVFYKLVATTDVLLTNLRLGVAERLGAGYDTLIKYNPKLIFAHGTGYGPKGPDANEPSSDYAGLVRSGFMSMVGVTGEDPPPFTAGIVDQIGAIMLAYGTMTALLVRERTGEGQKVDCSLLGAMLQLQQLALFTHLMGRGAPRVGRTQARNPLWNHYKCGDGQWMALSCLQPDRYWPAFCAVLGLSDLAEDPRMKERASRTEHAPEIVARADKVFLTKPRAHWLQEFRKRDVPSALLNTLNDLANDPQYIANNYILDFYHPAAEKNLKYPGIPIELSKTPGKIQGPAPEFGEHTEAIMLELGYTWDDIGGFKDKGVIG